MNESIRVLIVDDSEDDALLLAEELREAGYDLTYLRVDTPEAMRAALQRDTWALIIADYKMPKFSGLEALQVLQESGLDIPFILVSGTAGENIGVEMMHAGAQDFIVKSSLSRLRPAIARELGEAEDRRRRRAAEEAVTTSAENYRRMIDSAPLVIFTFDREGVILQVNYEFEQCFGFGSDEIVGRRLWEVFGRLGQSETRELARRVFAGETIKNTEWEDLRKDGSIVYLLANITPIYNERREITMALTMSADITDRKLAEQRRQAMDSHKREFYRRTILAATGGKLVITEPDEIEAIAGPALRTWEIESLADIDKARNDIRALATESGMDESRVPGFVGCAIEAMANVHKHADGGTITLHRVADSLMLVASDKGPGIEALSLPDVALKKGYSTAASLGMGYKVMIEFSDRVYLATSPEGTVVAVEMRLHLGTSPQQAALEALSGW